MAEANQRRTKFSRDEIIAAIAVVRVYGDYLRTFHPVYRILFPAFVPLSLLPLPLKKIEEALLTLESHYRRTSNIDGSEAIERAKISLLLYEADDEALRAATQVLLEPELRELIASKLKGLQDSGHHLTFDVHLIED